MIQTLLAYRPQLRREGPGEINISFEAMISVTPVRERDFPPGLPTSFKKLQQLVQADGREGGQKLPSNNNS